MKSSNRGGFSELMACAWLMSLGFDTFRNQNDNGPIDIIAVDRDTGETIFCDAKTFCSTNVENFRKNGYPQSSDQKRLGVKIIGVTHEGSCFWCTKEDV